MVQHNGLNNNEETTTNSTTIENKKTIIPLPAPSSTYSNGNAAYGGNQSFVHSSSDLIRGSCIQNDSSSYWTDSDGSVTAGTSNSVQRIPGVVGLTNIGNTCFMNSGLQCLLNTPTICEFFLKAKLPTGVSQLNLALLQNFQYVVKQAWCGPQPKLILHDFKNCVAIIHSQFKDSRQHDCQEFLALLLDSLHEQLQQWTELQETSECDSGVVGDSTNDDLSTSGSGNIVTSTIVSDSIPEINKNFTDENEPSSSISTLTATKVSEVRTLHHSSLKDHNVRRSNFEAKLKNQMKRVNGTPITKGFFPSYFNLPNFTPAAVKENQWMALKSPCTPLKSSFLRRRKKKCEDLGSPGCSKKTKLDICERQAEKTCQNNDNIILRDNDAHLNELETEKSQLPETINGVVKMSQNPCNGDIDITTTVLEEESLENCQKEMKKQQKPHRPTQAEEAKRASIFWDSHINANNTVIAKTFQGLLKSTVICSTCGFVSVTYDAFMYLPLPFPSILERNLSIWFISMKDQRRPKKIEVTVGIMDSVMELKQKLTQSIPVEDFVKGTINSENLVLAEVCNYTVQRLIENSTIVRKLNYNRNMYMYELNENFNEQYESLWIPTSEFNSYVIDNSVNSSSQFYGPWNNDTFHGNSMKTVDDNHLVQSTYTEENWDEEPISTPLSEKKSQDQQQTSRSSISSSEIDKQNSTRSNQSPEIDIVSSSVTDEQPNNSDCGSEVKTTLDPSNTMQCIICLEDCPVTDMRKHIGCICIICVSCLENSIKHHHPSPNASPVKGDSTNTELKCAKCMNVVDGKDFVQYRSFGENGSTKLTMELVHIIFRNDPNPDANNNSSPIPKVFGYPWLVKIPSMLPAQEFYDYIDSINPFLQVESKILTVQQDGKSCGQCSFGSSCHGCEFSRRGTITIRPRTSIAISYVDLNPDLLASIDPTDMTIEDNPYLTPWNRSNEPNYDIHDCLRAFSEIENLDEQNPWFCPHCEKNQCATKSLTVCRFPDYLIIYLKRFVFMDHSSNKLNNKVKFPVSDLDLNEYMAAEFAGKDWKYDLYGCICHFGSMSSGHYTSYGKNPVTNEWHYFNDDSVSAQCPQDVEHSSGYVLFYARKGLQYDIPNLQMDKVRPLPELVEYNNCSPKRSRPVNAVPPNSSTTDGESWEPEDQVSSSSAPYSQSKPVNCSFSGGSMNEMSLSVGVSPSVVSAASTSDWAQGEADEEQLSHLVDVKPTEECPPTSSSHDDTECHQSGLMNGQAEESEEVMDEGSVTNSEYASAHFNEPHQFVYDKDEKSVCASSSHCSD